MAVGGIDPSIQNHYVQYSQDFEEKDTVELDLKKQLKDLRGQMRSIANDEEKTEEEKSDEKKEVQKKIQELNAELRKHQIEKKLEDAEKKQEEKRKEVMETSALLFAAAAKEQIENMSEVRMSLEGKFATSKSDEEKTQINKRINSVFKRMGNAMREVNGTIPSFQKEQKIQEERAERQKERNRQMGKGSVVYSSKDGVVIKLASS